MSGTRAPQRPQGMEQSRDHEPEAPPPPRSPASKGSQKAFSLVGALVCILYLINPTAGFIELIPDNIPGFGNLDEATVTALLLFFLGNLGINLLPGRKREQDAAKNAKQARGRVVSEE